MIWGPVDAGYVSIAIGEEESVSRSCCEQGELEPCVEREEV